MHLSLIHRAAIVALGGIVALSSATRAHAQQVQTVFVIAMENHNLTQPNPLSSPQQVLGNVAAPFLNSLMTPGNANAVQSSFAKNYQNSAVGVHPSAPNYIWSQGGSNFGVFNDNDPFGTGGSAQTTPDNLSNYLQTAGIAWKAYAEDIDINQANNTVLPSNQWTVPLTSVSGTFSSGTNAYNGSNQYNYDVNHVPQVYFTTTNGGNNSTPSNTFAHHYAPLQQLQTDLTNNTVARYNWITPDLYNIAHDGLPNGFTYKGTHYTGDQAALAQGDNFLSIIVPQIEASQEYQNNGVIIIWFDETEGGDSPAWTIPEIIISPLAKGNAYSNSVLYTHSSDILTTEEIFGVGPCIAAACSANDLSDLFKPGVIGSGVTLSSISPSTGTQGSSVPVTLTGSGFVAPLTVNSGTGLAASNVSVVSSTSATATLDVAANATVGQHNVSVTTAAGTSGNVSFGVTSSVSPPTLSSISPSAGSQGSSFSVTLTGSGFVAPLSVNGGSGITISNVSVVSSTSATATFAIAAAAATGARNISVTTTAGTSGAATFTVNAPGGLPTLTSIAPASGALGTSVNVTLTGTNFTSASQVRLQGTGLTQTNIVVVSPTQITATYSISSSVALGAHNTWVVTSAGSSSMLTFTVTAAGNGPTLASVAPNTGVQGTTVNVTLTGTNFIAGATVGAAGSGITVSNVVVASATQITATLTLAANATVGQHNLSVTTTAGGSGTVPFGVTATGVVPTLTSVAPNSGVQGTAVNVTLTGTGFVAPLTVHSGSGITVSNVSVVSSTSATATFNIAASAATGASNVSVTTAGGTSGSLSFSVTAAVTVPTLSSISPSAGTQGSAFSVTLTGSGFVAPLTVNGGSGLTVSNVSVVSSTSATATFTIAASAAPGARNVSVTTTGGTSNTAVFTVNLTSTLPTLTSVSPSSGARGTSVNVTLTGTNFTSGSRVGLQGAGLKQINIVVVSSTQITATFTISPTVATGPHNTTIVTSAGTSNILPFTVN